MSVKGGDIIFQFKSDDKELQNSIDNMGSSIKKMVTALGLDRLINKTLSALNNSLDGAIERVDTLNNFPRVMENLGISAEDSSEAMQELNDGLLGLPTTLNQGVSAVQRFTSQNGDVKKSAKIFLALNNAILAGGASTEVQASAMEQLSQAYAKGKPDALEWRSMLTAMPAQLKQVAQYLGYTSTAVGGDLYEAIKSGRISMDDLMDAIMTLNTTGVDQYASFTEQAKASTGGLKTSITNVKTAITRGLANGIDALNESLKKSNLPTINEMIQKLGEAITKAFKKIAEGIKKIPWNKLKPVIKEVVDYIKRLKDIAFGFIKEVLKQIDWNALLQMAPTMLKIVATIKILNPLIKTGTSIIGGFVKVFKGLTSPLGIATTIITGLATAFVFLSAQQTDLEKNTKNLEEQVKNSNQALKDYNDSIDQNVDKEVTQIDNAKRLNDELKTLVDENGHVKEGYEDRVGFIVNELNNALGTEIKLVDGQIQGYQDLQAEIDKTIEKKRAQAILDGEYQKYQNALSDQKDALEQMNGILEQTNMEYDDIQDSIDYVNSHTLAENIDKFGTETTYALLTLGDEFQELDSRINTNTKNMMQYEEDYARFTREEYSEIGKSVKTSTEDWEDSTVETIKKAIEKKETEIKNYEQYYKKTNDAIAKNEIDRLKGDLTNLQTQLRQRESTIKTSGTKEVNTWKTISDNIKNVLKNQENTTKTSGQKAGQNYADGISSKQAVVSSSVSGISGIVSNTLSSSDSWTWGADMVSSMASGINQKAYEIAEATRRVANTIFRNLHFSRPDEGVLRNYEKWMPDFVEGLSRTLQNSAPNLYKAVNNMASNMKDQLSMGLNMSPTLNNVSSFSPSVSVKVINNMETDFMGNLVSNIKTFSNGSKNDYNYGIGG